MVFPGGVNHLAFDVGNDLAAVSGGPFMLGDVARLVPPTVLESLKARLPVTVG